MWPRLLVALLVIVLTVTGVFFTQAQVDAPSSTALGPTEAVAPDPEPATTTTQPPPPSPTADPTSPPSTAAAATTPAPTPAATATPAGVPAAPGTPQARLAARLQRLVDRTAIPGTATITVVDNAGTPLFSHRAGRAVLPASTQKLSIAAAGLARLGTDYRYTTTVRVTATPDGDGVVKGDLVLVGGGDPALAGPSFATLEPDRPRTPLETLARRIRRAGVHRVTGRILADPSIFADEPIAAGWAPRYFAGLDATRISGLTVDAGRRVFRRDGQLREKPARDPAVQAGVMLRRALRAVGVRVAKAPRRAASPTSAVDVASVSSPRMEELLRYMVQHSDNHLADTIFRSLGAAEGDSTWVGAAGATAQILAPLELDWSGVVLADGSGLSRSNRVSPSFLAQLQARMWNSSLSNQWIDLMAVSGRSGTLRYRLREGIAAGRVYAKTGSLRDVTALVGTVVGPPSHLWHFAVVGNNLQGTYAMRTLTDRSVEIMAEELYGCRRRRPPGRTPNGKPRPPRLVCAVSG